MKTIDKDVLDGYNAGLEKNRLRKGLGLIEYERTKEILRGLLPPPPAIVYDIGGGYGEYACWLAALGYETYLYDLSEKNIKMAAELQKERNVRLNAASVADARSIDRPDESADAVLLMGPLYHITSAEERRLALLECRRLLKPGGLLFTSAITRYATTLWAVTTYDKNGLLDEPEFYEMLEREIRTGDHIRNPGSRYNGMGRSYFHLPAELEAEINAAGFADTEVHGMLGPCWLIPALDDCWEDANKRESILRIVRLCEKEESIMGLSTHLLGISRKEKI
jgi:SAM-dependent methyltransferase